MEIMEKQNSMEFENMIMRIAEDKKIISKAIHTIPNLTGMMMNIADALFFEMAEVSKGQHTYNPKLVEKCCQYLFKKSAEAVHRWGESEDGKVELDSGIAEVVAKRLPFDALPKMREAYTESDEFGAALFEGHISHIEAQTQYSGEVLMVEIILLFRWCVNLGISNAISRKCHKGIPPGQKIESIVPTTETFLWIRRFKLGF